MFLQNNTKTNSSSELAGFWKVAGGGGGVVTVWRGHCEVGGKGEGGGILAQVFFILALHQAGSLSPNEPIDVHDGCDRDGSAGFACQGGRGRNHGSCGRVHSGALSPCGCSLAPAGREVELCRHAGGDHEDDQQGGYDGTNHV